MTEPIEELDSAVRHWNDAVREGKVIVELGEATQLRLGELADEVESEYGKKKLAEFAKAIGVAACTLKRRRSAYRAWKKTGAAPPRLYSVAQDLAAHPDRAKIVAENPNLTAREARELTREAKAHKDSAQNPKPPKDSAEHHHKRTIGELVSLANAAIRATGFVDQPVPPELRESIELDLLKIIRQGGEALVKAADFMQELLEPARSNGHLKTATSAALQ